jgi:oxidase EvaA
MQNSIKIANSTSFFFSSQVVENQFQSFDQFLVWFSAKKDRGFVVQEIPFSQLDQWYFTHDNESLVHKSGKFFRIEGLRVQSNFGHPDKWEQPIINQPEIGILGILTKVFNGTRYFLMQAKMEPGNVNLLQLSPTVQATKSNFSRVHQGKLPAYLEYFLGYPKSRVLIDQLQTEQGARFLRKRNRNIVIEIDEEVEVLEDFCWLTLGEIKKLIKIDNFINMDARSVISIIPMVDDEIIAKTKMVNWQGIDGVAINGYFLDGIDFNLFYSACSGDAGLYTRDQIISWYTEQKVRYELNVEKKPLSELKDWIISDERIFNNDRYFSVIGVSVKAGTREVKSWTQPLIKDVNIGLLGFLIKRMNGILHFLVQAKVEPGNMDIIELSPTVTCSNYEYLQQNEQQKPPFFDHFLGNENTHSILDTLQSEEGGRFYHMQNRNMIVELDENRVLELPSNYTWMTLNQMMDFMRYSMFNIEARSLIASLNFNQ